MMEWLIFLLFLAKIVGGFGGALVAAVGAAMLAYVTVEFFGGSDGLGRGAGAVAGIVALLAWHEFVMEPFSKESDEPG